VPIVLAITARRNWIRCSASDSGVIATPIVDMVSSAHGVFVLHVCVFQRSLPVVRLAHLMPGSESLFAIRARRALRLMPAFRHSVNFRKVLFLQRGISSTDEAAQRAGAPSFGDEGGPRRWATQW